MKGLSVKWQKLIIWLTGYVNLIAFVIAGGYLFKNTESEDVKRSAKAAFIVEAIFTAIEIVFLIIRNCVSLAEDYADWLNKTSLVIAIINAVVYVVMLIVDLTVGLGSAKPAQTVEENQDKNDAE